MSPERRRLLHSQSEDNSISDRVYQGTAGLTQLYANDGITAPNPEHFDLRTRVAQISSYRVQSIRTTPLLLPAPVDEPETRVKVRLTIIRDGRMQVLQNGKKEMLHTGDALISFDALPAAFHILDRSRIVSVSVDTYVPFPNGAPVEQRIRMIGREELFNAAAASFFEALLRPAAFPLEPVDEVRVSRAIGKVFSEVFIATDPESESPAARRAEERTVVRGYISAHFTRPELSVSSIAEHYGMSPRSLQRLYADHGENVSNMIRQRRLEHAVSILLDRRFDDLSIDDVASRSGFAGANQLRRVMSQVMDQTPSQLRARHE